MLYNFRSFSTDKPVILFLSPLTSAEVLEHSSNQFFFGNSQNDVAALN